MRLSLKWNVVPFVVTGVFVLVGVIILLYNNSISPHGEGSNWPSPGAATQWGQYISVAILSLLALIVAIIGVIKKQQNTFESYFQCICFNSSTGIFSHNYVDVKPNTVLTVLS